MGNFRLTGSYSRVFTVVIINTKCLGIIIDNHCLGLAILN